MKKEEDLHKIELKAYKVPEKYFEESNARLKQIPSSENSKVIPIWRSKLTLLSTIAAAAILLLAVYLWPQPESNPTENIHLADIPDEEIEEYLANSYTTYSVEDYWLYEDNGIELIMEEMPEPFSEDILEDEIDEDILYLYL